MVNDDNQFKHTLDVNRGMTHFGGAWGQGGGDLLSNYLCLHFDCNEGDHRARFSPFFNGRLPATRLNDAEAVAAGADFQNFSCLVLTLLY